MCTINNTRGRPFGPDGCQVPCGSGVCGETRTLEIINEFQRLYEEKMNQIDTFGGGDCMQEKIKLQQEWIGDLTEQNQMLICAVEELEHEATERVHLLEEKIQQSAQCVCEVMKRYREYDVTNDLLAEPLQKVFCLENDQKNLLEFIRRIREENRWDVNGLKFFEVSYQDLIGSAKPEQHFSDIESKNEYINTTITKEQSRVKERECKILELTKKVEYYNSFGNIQSLVEDIKIKTAECECLKKSMEETKQALVAEIASKHDIIVQLKTDCQQLEERCIQADKHTVFRDDIIKELRKEIKQLKQQVSRPEKPFKTNSPPDIEKKNVDSEPYIIINHTKKIVQSGKSTVIYLRDNAKEKSEEKMSKSFKTLYEKHTSSCSKCREKLESALTLRRSNEHRIQNDTSTNFEEEKTLHLCKSENDLYDFKKLLRPVKERLKFTASGFSRCNTFVGSTSDVLKNVDFESRLKHRNVSVPNHIPVKMYVNNIEVNKNKR